MKEQVPENTSTELVNFLLISTLLALSTKDTEAQEDLIQDLIKETAKQIDKTLTSGTKTIGLPETTRNALFAECTERLADIKKTAVAIARNLRDSQ